MISLIGRYGSAFIVLALFFGCHKEESTQLVDVGAGTLEIDPAPVYYQSFDSLANDLPGYFVAKDRALSAQLIVEGSEFDGPGFHHMSAFAQARFFDWTQPIIVKGDTIDFSTVDAGTVSLDNLALRLVPRDVSLSGDSSASGGVQYRLYNNDGVGGRGIQYFGAHEYLWTASGSASLPSTQLSIVAPSAIHLTSPGLEGNISLTQDFVAEWIGGGDVVRFIFSVVSPNEGPRPVLKLRLTGNRGRTKIPSRIMRLLPAGQAQLLFTVVSGSASRVSVHGMAGDVSLLAETSHSLLLNVIP